MTVWLGFPLAGMCVCTRAWNRCGVYFRLGNTPVQEPAERPVGQLPKFFVIVWLLHIHANRRPVL